MAATNNTSWSDLKKVKPVKQCKTRSKTQEYIMRRKARKPFVKKC